MGETEKIDIENRFEMVTPLMLSILKEEFEMADTLLRSHKSNLFYVN